MGMTASSWEGWAELHVNPFVAMGYFYGFAALERAAAVYICTGVRGDDHMFYVVIVPLVSFVVMGGTALDWFVWRRGPATVKHKLFQAFVVLSTLSSMPMLYVGNLGPEATVPWHDRLQFLCAHAVFTFWIIQKCTAGAVPGEHPADQHHGAFLPVCCPCTSGA